MMGETAGKGKEEGCQQKAFHYSPTDARSG